MKPFIDRVRDRVEYTLEPTILAQCGTTTPLMQQYMAHADESSEDVLVALGLKLGVPAPSEVMERWKARRGVVA
jgi:hypothetical protein